MKRHPNRESVIGLYLRDHLGTDKVRIAENPSTLVIVFCIDDVRGRRHRLGDPPRGRFRASSPRRRLLSPGLTWVVIPLVVGGIGVLCLLMPVREPWLD